jgi:hypothetical protein
MEDFDINATLGLKAAAPADAAQKLRGNRFDRADFAARRPVMPQETPKQPLPPVLPAPKVASAEPQAALTATGPLTATATSEQLTDAAQVTEDHLRELGWSRAKIKKILGGPEQADDSPDSSADDPTAQAEAHLLSLGWSKSDIARLLVGPKQSHLTAEALFRQHAANSAGDQEALLKALARAGAQRVKPDPSLLSGLNVAHLSPEEPTDLEQIISQFAALPDVQKQRFLLLLDSQKPSKKNSAPSRDRTSTPPAKTSGGSPKSAGPAGDVLPVVKSSLDLLSTALKGLLGTGKDGSKKGPSGPGGRTKTSAEDEPDSDESSSQADDDTADEDQDDSMDDVSSTEEDTSSPSDPEEPIAAGNESEPD